MDHAYNSIEPFMAIEIDYLYNEWSSGQYAKLSECPSYKAAKALNDAANILRKFMGWDTYTLREHMRFKEEGF